MSPKNAYMKKFEGDLDDLPGRLMHAASDGVILWDVSGKHKAQALTQKDLVLIIDAYIPDKAYPKTAVAYVNVVSKHGVGIVYLLDLNEL